jgi:hypothetical protein
LADWAARYDSFSSKPIQKREWDIDSLPVEPVVDEDNDDEVGDEKSAQLNSKNRTPVKRQTPRIIRSVWYNKETNSENHYCELIMLFTPWRNEETDLIGKYSTYEERYLELANEIAKQMSRYAVCPDD